MSKQQKHLGMAACIINPGAAQKKWLRRKWFKRYLAELPGEKFNVLSDKENMIRMVRELSPHHQTIVAIGGDGTIADVLQGIREAGKQKEIVLGIVPMGSGNAFRKSLAIPKSIKKAIRLLYDGEPKAVSLMDIEGLVSGFSSIGATAMVTDVMVRREARGFWGHVLAGTGLLSVPKWDVEVELEDGIDDHGDAFHKKDLKLKMLDCVVAKSSYFGYSWRIAPQASLADGYLDITFFEMSGYKYALLLPLLYFGLYQRTLRHFKARRMVLKGKDLPVQYHGEFLGTRNKVEVTVLPQVIRIIGPSST
jgi:diacylglycerol kinase family enzyme